MNRFFKVLLAVMQGLKLDTVLIQFAKWPIFGRLWENKGARYYQRIARDYQDALRQAGVDLRDKEVLEIGSGNSVGAGYFLRDQQFRSWLASDTNRNPKNDRALSHKELKIAKAAGCEVKCADGNLSYPTGLDFTSLDITKHRTELKNAFDVILSNAVLEHVPQSGMDKAFRNMATYLRKGGCMLHIIDLRDHVNFNNPFGFYKYDEEVWQHLAQGSLLYTNRLRLSDFVTLGKVHGLTVKVLRADKHPLPKKIHPSLAATHSEDDLRVSVCTLLLRHNGK